MSRPRSSTRPPSPPNPSRLLEAVPIPNHAVRCRKRGSELVLYVPLKRRWFTSRPLSLLLPLRDERGYGLDALGQEVWNACDGKSSVEQVVEGFADRHRLGFHEARLAVMQFLRTLAERKLVVLLMPEGRGAEDAPVREDAAEVSA